MISQARRSELARQYRLQLLADLGGRCARCGATEGLEIHHVNGTTWNQRRSNSYWRVLKFRAELKAGVPLQALCRVCNAIIGRPWYVEQ